jgi:branched-chain amino acid transport system substrate-binding protein
MVKFARQNLKAKTAAVMTNNSSDYSKGLSEVFIAGFKKAGGTIVDTKEYQDADTEYRSQLTSIKAKDPDVIYIPDYYNKNGAMAKQARTVGLTRQALLGGDGWDSPKIYDIGKDAINNSYFTNHYAPMDKNPVVSKFVEGYRKLYKETPDALAACAYDAAYIMADAIRRAGSTDRGKIRDALASTKGFVGVTGTITINKDHNVTKPLAVLKIQDAKQEFVTVVSP